MKEREKKERKNASKKKKENTDKIKRSLPCCFQNKMADSRRSVIHSSARAISFSHYSELTVTQKGKQSVEN
jgi:hypothetical protein